MGFGRTNAMLGLISKDLHEIDGWATLGNELSSLKVDPLDLYDVFNSSFQNLQSAHKELVIVRKRLENLLPPMTRRKKRGRK